MRLSADQHVFVSRLDALLSQPSGSAAMGITTPSSVLIFASGHHCNRFSREVCDFAAGLIQGHGQRPPDLRANQFWLSRMDRNIGILCANTVPEQKSVRPRQSSNASSNDRRGECHGLTFYGSLDPIHWCAPEGATSALTGSGSNYRQVYLSVKTVRRLCELFNKTRVFADERSQPGDCNQLLADSSLAR